MRTETGRRELVNELATHRLPEPLHLLGGNRVRRRGGRPPLVTLQRVDLESEPPRGDLLRISARRGATGGLRKTDQHTFSPQSNDALRPSDSPRTRDDPLSC